MRTFLTARWRYLVMLNYAVDPKLLVRHVPPGTELDDYQGTNFLSVVGFLFQETRIRGIPVPFHRNFEEVNLRFYVRRRAAEGWRRGVVFIKEIVPRRAIATLARLCYNEPYVSLPMRHRIELMGETLAPNSCVEYGWRQGGRWNRLCAWPQGEPTRVVAESQAAFITEHYWGYNTQRNGRCMEYQVIHEPWRVWQVSEAVLDCDVAAVYGPHFSPFLTSAPLSAFVAEGSAVQVHVGACL